MGSIPLLTISPESLSAFETLVLDPSRLATDPVAVAEPEVDFSSWPTRFPPLLEPTPPVFRLAQHITPTPSVPLDRSQLMTSLSALFVSSDYHTLLSGTYSGKQFITPADGRVGQVTLTTENFPGTKLPMNHVVTTIENADSLDLEALYTALTRTGDYPQFYRNFYELFYVHTRHDDSTVAIPNVGLVDDWHADYWFNTTKPKDNPNETPTDYPDGYGMNHDRSYAWRDANGEMTAFVFGWEMMSVDGKLFREAARLKYKKKELLGGEGGNRAEIEIAEIDQRLQEIKGKGDDYTNLFIDGKFRFPSKVKLDNDGTPDSEGLFGHAPVEHNTGGYMVWYDKENKRIHVEVYLVSVPGQKATDNALVQFLMASAQRQAGEGLVRYTLKAAIEKADKQRSSGSE